MYTLYTYIGLEVCGFLTKATLFYLRICMNLVLFLPNLTNAKKNFQGKRRGNLYYTRTIIQRILPIYVHIIYIYR